MEIVCIREKVSFYIEFEDSVGIGNSEMIREGIPKRRACTRLFNDI